MMTTALLCIESSSLETFIAAFRNRVAISADTHGLLWATFLSNISVALQRLYDMIISLVPLLLSEDYKD